MIAPAHGAAGQAAAAPPDALPLLVLAAVAVGYLVLARHRAREARGWPPERTVSFLTGVVLLALGLDPQMVPYPADGLPAHMYQHLLIGMYAPLGLVLGAPMTLMLRSVPRRYGKAAGRVLRSGPMHVLAHPVTALLLSVGGLVVLYFTPLYAAADEHPVLHELVHVHFLASGYLFAWVIAGPDPAPRRPSVPARLVLLGVAIAAHAAVSQLMYAGLFVQIPATVAELRQAGELMYYAGDIAELLLAFALVSGWRPAPRGRNNRQPRNARDNTNRPAPIRPCPTPSEPLRRRPAPRRLSPVGAARRPGPAVAGPPERARTASCGGLPARKPATSGRSPRAEARSAAALAPADARV